MEKFSFPEQWLQVFDKFSLDFFVLEFSSPVKVLHRGGKTSSYFGYPIDIFVSHVEQPFEEFILEGDRSYVFKAMNEAVMAKIDIDLQFHVICFDKSISLIHVMGTYLYSSKDIPTYLFLLSDAKENLVPIDINLEYFRLCFFVDTGSLVEVNLKGRRAFHVDEFTDMYEAIAFFVTRYVHPQDRKAFANFITHTSLDASVISCSEEINILFRRASNNEVFSGYRWAHLSYSFKNRGLESGIVCELIVQDADKTGSSLAEKTLQTQLDPLTGVLNRLALEAQVTQQIELCRGKNSMGAFFMLDIDRFKLVNDTFGHDRGDQVLCQVAQAIRKVFRPTDIIARQGGDEFAVFITGIPSHELAMTKAENMCNALRLLGKLEDGLVLSCSVGVSIFPDHGTSFTELYHTSDLALYQAKRKGRDQYCLYGAQALPFVSENPIDREWLFSQLEEEIYLCNVDTYELLFVNDAKLKRLGLAANEAKGFCYEVLHHRSLPCEDCKNLYMKTNQVSTRVSKDIESNTLFLVREKGLLLQGSRVKLAVTTPMPQAWMDFLLEYVSVATLETMPWW